MSCGHLCQLLGCVVVLVDEGDDAVQLVGTVILHAVLVARERGYELHEVGGVGAVELGTGHLVEVGVILAVDGVAVERAEVGALVELVHLAALLLQRHKLLPCGGVYLGVGEELLHELQRLCLVLVKTRERDLDLVAACRHVVGAGELVKLLLELLGGHGACAQIVEVAGGEVQALVGLGAEVEGKLQGEQSVARVLDILHGQALLGLAEGEVALEVDKNGGDGLHLRADDLCHEGALLIAVCGYGRDLRLVYFLLR